MVEGVNLQNSISWLQSIIVLEESGKSDKYKRNLFYMTKVVLYIATSKDGFIADEKGSVDCSNSRSNSR